MAFSLRPRRHARSTTPSSLWCTVVALALGASLGAGAGCPLPGETPGSERSTGENQASDTLATTASGTPSESATSGTDGTSEGETTEAPCSSSGTAAHSGTDAETGEVGTGGSESSTGAASDDCSPFSFNVALSSSLGGGPALFHAEFELEGSAPNEDGVADQFAIVFYTASPESGAQINFADAINPALCESCIWVEEDGSGASPGVVFVATEGTLSVDRFSAPNAMFSWEGVRLHEAVQTPGGDYAVLENARCLELADGGAAAM